MFKIDVEGKGYFEVSLNETKDFPGVDIEFIPINKTGEELSFPRIVMEYHEEKGVHAHIWDDSTKEDSTVIVKFEC